MTKATVRTALVVMLEVDPLDASEMLAADDQQVVKTFAAYGPDPPLGVGVRVGRLHR